MRSPVRIVAFGDSLTTGYQSPTAENPDGTPTPYGRFLQQSLGETAEVLIRGLNGERTTEMLLRLDADLVSAQPDFAVILGGTNDLGWGVPPDEVAQTLVTIYKRVRERGIAPVAVTVPSIRGYDAYIAPRRVLNTLIIDFCRMESLPYCDLFAATSEPGTLRLAERFSNDGLHLTTAGYQLLADRLYQDVFEPALNNRVSQRPDP